MYRIKLNLWCISLTIIVKIPILHIYSYDWAWKYSHKEAKQRDGYIRTTLNNYFTVVYDIIHRCTYLFPLLTQKQILSKRYNLMLRKNNKNKINYSFLINKYILIQLFQSNLPVEMYMMGYIYLLEAVIVRIITSNW